MNVLASNVITKHKTRDPYKIAKQNGIMIIAEPLGKVCGYYNSINNKNFIHINESLPAYYRRYVVAHMLYRFFTNPADMLFLKEKTGLHFTDHEKRANAFAVNLLFDEQKVEQFENLDEYFAYHGLDSAAVQDLFARFEHILNSKKPLFAMPGDLCSTCSRTNQLFYIIKKIKEIGEKI